MLDLDRSLFEDYSSVRKKSAAKVISTLIGDLSDKKSLCIYEWILRHSIGFQMMGLPDFRRFWNDAQFYIAALVISEMDTISFSKLEKEITKAEPDKDHLEKATDFLSKPEIISYMDKQEQIESDPDEMKKIFEAVREFDKLTQKILFPQSVKRIIKQLIKKGIEPYVVTEGERAIQLEKFKKLRLSEIIGLNHLIIVDQKNCSSFLKILRAIQLFPECPQQFLDKNEHPSDNLVINRSELRVASIGDRYDKDIEPLVKLFGNKVITIRLLTGEYKSDYSNSYLKDSKRTLPTKTAENLSEALRYLMNDQTWETVETLDPFEMGKVD
jgi:hypothetical protein